MKRKATSPISFACRVWPDFHQTGKRGHYFDIRIFETQQDMHATLIAECEDEKKVKKCTAHFSGRECYQFSTNEKGTKAKSVGVLSFFRGKHGPGILSHEAAHAALYFAAIKKLPILEGGDAEERFALAVGEIVRQTNCELERVNWLQ